MPPGQPVHKCADCGRYRPCKAFPEWLCVDCSPLQPGAGSAAVATDGGEPEEVSR